MQATIDRDLITVLGRGPVTIPDDYPRDVGLERLRWNGSQIIDLATLNGFWVEHKNGMFVLHCMSMLNTTFIEMSYAQRKLLYYDGSIKIRTSEQIASDLYTKQVEAIKNLLSNKLETAGNVSELLMVIVGLIAVVAIYARTGNAAAGTYLTSILPKLQALPLTRIQGLVPGAADTMKTVFDLYFSKMDELSGT
jgi:hypothetical protein